MSLIAAKFFLSPFCVVLVSMAGRRWGIKATGVLGSLPVVGGPILLVIALGNGSSFGAEAAASSVLGLSALTAFVVVYGRAAQKLGSLPSVLLGLVAFLGGVAILNLIPQAAGSSLLIAGLSFWVGLKLLPAPTGQALIPVRPPWWDLPLRALAALGLVVAVAAASSALGPQLSGLLTPFPIISSVLAVFTHVQGGTQQVIVLLRSFLYGYYSYATFSFVVAITLPNLAIAPTFLLASAICLLVQFGVFRLVGRRSARLRRGDTPAMR